MKNKGLKKIANKTEVEEGTCANMVNRYGTYNIQPTNDMENEFPQIAQGRPKKK